MKDECGIVRDLLPLYVEGMASEASEQFVKGHIAQCSECEKELRKIRWNNEQTQQEGAEAILELKMLRRKLRLKKYCSIAAAILCLLIFMGAVDYFLPVYRMARTATLQYFDEEEVRLLAHIASAEEKNIANEILIQAEEAFQDISHSGEENREKYGVLSRYAFEETYGAVKEEHSIELWSVHVEGDQGQMWVRYSQEAFNEKGEKVSGNWNVLSLWTITRNEQGQWQVVSIKEHP